MLKFSLRGVKHMLDNNFLVEATSNRNNIQPTEEGVFMIIGKDDKAVYPGTNVRTELVVPNVSQYLNSPVIRVTGVIKYENIESIINNTLVQVGGRTSDGRGKPLIVIDTHEGFINIRFRDFDKEEYYGKEWMERFPVKALSVLPFSEINFELEINWIKGEIYFYVLNGTEEFWYKHFHRNFYWKNSHNYSIHLSFGLYRTKKLNYRQKILFTSLDCYEDDIKEASGMPNHNQNEFSNEEKFEERTRVIVKKMFHEMFAKLE